MPDSVVQTLFKGPIDIVGDIHGEIDALRDLLDHLGYADDGSHPEERWLVFLGDLTDRVSTILQNAVHPCSIQ